ncbi:MAG: flagellar filament capping protein FliD [Gracilibacteraceae bacterium]|jgi:flagellar hook-associated protein 2|nr:flagellar filament capping protein FliD [Gracilibacteraceae bacterium]
MFSSVSGTSNSTVSKGISGLASGMDTDELVTQLTSGTTSRIDKQLQEKQKVVWKQEIYRNITTALQEFNSKYFSSSSALDITSAKFFEQYALQSSSNKVALSGDLSVANNVQIESISQLAAKAQASFSVSKEITSAIDDSKLTNIASADALNGAKITLYLDGTYKTLELDTSSYNTDTILADFRDKLKDAFGEVAVKDSSGVVSMEQAVDVKVTGSTGNWKLEVVVADKSSNFAVYEADRDGVLGTNGVFKDIFPRMLNKHTLDSTLGELGVSQGTHTMKINGVDITAKDTDTLGDLIRNVNANVTDVTMSYSTTTGLITLTSNNSGATESIKIEGSATTAALFGKKADGSSGVTITPTAQEMARGQNARATVTVNGATMQVERATNSISIDGLNIELKDTTASSGERITFSATLDTEKVTSQMKEFIDQYNAIVKQINDQILTRPDRDFQPLTSTQKKDMSDREIEQWETNARAGLLYGDSTLSGILSSMRTALYSVTEGVSGVMGDIGIQTGDYILSGTGSLSKNNNSPGQLSFDETKFRTALAANPEKVKSLFTAQSDKNYNPEASAADVAERFRESGFAARLSDILRRAVTTSNPKGSLLEIAGLKDDRTDTSNKLTTQIQSIDARILELQKKLATERKRYLNQFTALEKYIQQMNMQSSMLFSDSGQS